jgi:D-arabinose 1-dehydrogenase-like Zn-dependent alcohol dehydrogenase
MKKGGKKGGKGGKGGLEEDEKDKGRLALYPACKAEEASVVSWVWNEAQTIPSMYFHKAPGLEDSQVRVNITHFAIGATDVLAVAGKLGEVSYPFCGGQECLGVISALGPKCTIREVGERVVVCPVRSSCQECRYCLDEKEDLCLSKELLGEPSSRYFGGFSSQVVVGEEYTVHLPKEIPSQ